MRHLKETQSEEHSFAANRYPATSHPNLAARVKFPRPALIETPGFPGNRAESNCPDLLKAIDLSPAGGYDF
jgi:hypothetical protein